MGYLLHIGNYQLSSWSLRPWLLMREAGIPFEARRILLDRPDSKANILQVSPSGRVPCLHDGALRVWDSLAIAEYLAERHPGLWPADPAARAWARSISAEMHSGFTTLRSRMPMKVADRLAAPEGVPELAADIARITGLWEETRRRFGEGGDLLFGRFSIADAFYAPVVFRFQTYGVPLERRAADYQQAMLRLAGMREWAEAAASEFAQTPNG
jgi:glutathione S-transferase